MSGQDMISGHSEKGLEIQPQDRADGASDSGGGAGMGWIELSIEGISLMFFNKKLDRILCIVN